ncbi:relaxase/mobilization nuclease domain-containing protein [Dysosmobacter sp.]|uniref:relaxase/mobilization nuclease domain-containing protein n=1 Tax=Dysosmobacter sp. TaxID=2591382 RepID=UPI003AEF4445
MATFTAVKNRGGGRGALGGVLRYTQQEEKTLWEGRRLVTGWNCTAQSALSEMLLTKERYRKTDGRQYYHFVQSFAEDDDLTPQEAHAIALELVQRELPDFEVLVATHIDTDHLHSHLIVNSVSFQDGRKLHQSAADLQAHRLASDEICAAHGLDILPPPQKQVKQKRMGTREYRSAAKGQSWKFRLMNTIDQCMRYAATKNEFLSLMESEGYQVRWTDSRKNITYTTPEGMKCRDDRLHEEKYTKEVMEREFRIRAEIVRRRTETAEPAAGIVRTGHADGCPHEAELGRSAGGTHGPVPAGENEQQPTGASGGQRCGTGGSVSGVEPAGGAAPRPGPAGGTGAGCGPNESGAATGWEKERATFFSAQDQTSQTTPAVHPLEPPAAGADDPGADWGRVVGGLVQLGKAVERSPDADPVRDATTTHQRTDKKTLRKERKKKIALGHKEDDHEEEPTWHQTMS